ncbi:MAG: lipoyl protein ligase domain-containing protein [Kineosporiaceae bacterium]
MRTPLVVLRTPDGMAPLDDVALGPALLTRAQADPDGAPVLRLAWPRPTLAFSRLDTLAPGWPDALAAARAHGFEPVVRQRGGRAAAYHEGCLLLDLVSPDRDPRSGIRARYVAGAAVLAGALADLGLDARVGAVPGEYCPGDFSVSSGGRVKLAGTAQRVVRGAWLLSSMLVVRGADRLRAVLGDVHHALALDWDPASVGAVEGVLRLDVAGAVPSGLGRDVLERIVLARYAASGHDVRPAPWPADLLGEARAQHERHRVA